MHKHLNNFTVAAVLLAARSITSASQELGVNRQFFYWRARYSKVIRDALATRRTWRRVSYRYVDLTGQRFGAWTVIERAPNGRWGHSQWLCRHDNGETQLLLSSHLRAGPPKFPKRNKTNGASIEVTAVAVAWVEAIDKQTYLERGNFKK